MNNFNDLKFASQGKKILYEWGQRLTKKKISPKRANSIILEFNPVKKIGKSENSRIASLLPRKVYKANSLPHFDALFM